MTDVQPGRDGVPAQSEEERMKGNRLMAFGVIRKGRSERCMLVVLDQRFAESQTERDSGLASRCRRAFRMFTPAVARP